MYQSPLHILAGLDDEMISPQSDSKALLRLRKKLLAEFNLHQTPSIEVNGRSYSKDDVIKTIDQLIDNPSTALHLYIFANKNLLDFLENDNSKVSPEIIKPLVTDSSVGNQLLPVLMERLVFNLKKSMYARDFNKAKELAGCAVLFQREEQDYFYEQINTNIERLIEQIEVLKNEDITAMPVSLAYLKIYDSLPPFLNSLPEAFDGIIDNLVASIINSMVEYQKVKKHNRNYLFSVSKVLCEIKCSEELSKLVRSNHKAFTASYESELLPGLEMNKVVYFIIIVFVVSARVLITCDGSSGREFRYSNPVIPVTVSSTNFSEFDAYRRHILDSGNLHYNFPGFFVPVYLNELINGETPFKYIMKADPSSNMVDSTSTMVGVKNRSGKQLIVFVFEGNDARARYFSDNYTDSLFLKQSDKLCFYFGDSLHRQKPDSRLPDQLVNKEIADLFFKSVTPKTFEIMRKNYVLEIKPVSARARRKQPILELSPAFFTKDSIETNRLKLKAL